MPRTLTLSGDGPGKWRGLSVGMFSENVLHFASAPTAKQLQTGSVYNQRLFSWWLSIKQAPRHASVLDCATNQPNTRSKRATMTDTFAPFDSNQLLDAYRTAQSEASQKFGKLNILIAGNSGVGKSTVINAVFGRQLAKTGVGASQTKEIEAYQTADSPLRIYDTRGFEIRSAQETISLVQEKLKSLRRSTEPEDQIHLAWLCILEQSHRVEDVHTGTLRTLAQLGVPKVVVLTQAFGEEEMARKVRALAVPNDGVVSVMAEPKAIGNIPIAASGISELIETSIKLLPAAQKAAFVAAQKARWDLKERAVVTRINVAASAAAGSALIPVPLAHSLALLPIQVALLVDINRQLGLTLTDTNGSDALAGFVGMILAKAGGQTAFYLTMTELMKLIPGFGWGAGAVVGAPIAATLTKLLGHVYFDSVKEYAQKGESLPSTDVLAARVEAMLAQNKNKYSNLSRSADASA